MQTVNQNPLARVISLIANERIQYELNLEGPQLMDFKESFDKLKEDVLARVEELQRKPHTEKKKLRPQLLEQVTVELQEFLTSALRPEQLERYRQLRLQKDGLAAFTDDGVRKHLDFSEQQMQKLKTIVIPGMKRVAATMKSGTDINGKTLAEVQEEELGKVIGLMTEEQLAKWQALKGEAFTFDEAPLPAATGVNPVGPGSRGPGRSGPAAPAL